MSEGVKFEEDVSCTRSCKNPLCYIMIFVDIHESRAKKANKSFVAIRFENCEKKRIWQRTNQMKGIMVCLGIFGTSFSLSLYPSLLLTHIHSICYDYTTLASQRCKEQKNYTKLPNGNEPNRTEQNAAKNNKRTLASNETHAVVSSYK